MKYIAKAQGATFELRHALRPANPTDCYSIVINRDGIKVVISGPGGAWAAIATLRQLLREYGRRLPCLEILDWADFPRRGVMLDISRGRVPRLQTLLALVDHLADFKINEFQLYTEHTFAYRKYQSVWKKWGAITTAEIRKLDARCRELGIELVPNQNSFGHLREFLADPRLKPLAEVAEAWPDAGGAFLRRPSTLAPNHPDTLPFLRGLYDELLPNFSSPHFNVGCDETFDLGRGQSRKLCARLGNGPVYLSFLKKIHRELSRRKKRMMFWGDIILKYPELVRELPRDLIALNWGYEASHPFPRETAIFKRAGVPFYVCPGTSTWMTMVGRNDNAFANLSRAAFAGRKNGASGYLITDWGDGGHPQPLAVSYAPYLHGAALAWCAEIADSKLLAPVLDRDVFHDSSNRAADAALRLGLAHRKLRFAAPNFTPLGAVIAAPPPEQREVFCYQGLSCYSRILPKNIRATIAAIQKQRHRLQHVRPATRGATILVRELDIAARMAVESCRFMLWQQALAQGRVKAAQAMANKAVPELQKLERDFTRCWKVRNKPTDCARFLRWRIADYRRGHV